MKDPVRYLWTSADFPESEEPIIPKCNSGTSLANVHSWLLTKESRKI
jgi:hypothetical protein